MLNFSEKYKIKIINNKTNIIAANHKNKELLISKNIKLNITNDGKLKATFTKSVTKPQTVFEALLDNYFDIPYIQDDNDCSVIISDPSGFNYCMKKNGKYHMSGANVTFNGTENNDTLILSNCNNSKINMGEGNDAVLYRENKITNNDINLGNGDNIFTATGITDGDMPLGNNKITSGNGHDYIYLRNAIGNDINTGANDDIIEIKGAPQTKFSNYFYKNTINTGDGNDEIIISGDFDKFSNNQFYLGKGSDNFCAEINSKDDANTEFDYNRNLSKYINSVSGNTIYATNGEKGFFEKNIFEAKTYSANRLSETVDFNTVSKGFQEIYTKTVPIEQITTPTEEKTTKPTSIQEKLENAKKRYWAGSLGWNLFKDPKMQKAAFKAVEDYVNLMK